MVYSINKFLPDFESEAAVNESLRERLRKYFDCEGVSLVSSGTIGLEVALKALSLPRGTHVLVPDISFIATATAVANSGLIPVYCDVSENYYGVTLESIKKNFTLKTGAVIVVHIAGYINREIFKIKEFCKEKNIYLIEDAAQAFPCTVSGKHVGCLGDIGVVSLQSSKIVSSGEGGIVITKSPKISTSVNQIINWGLSNNARNVNIPAGNYRLSSLQSYFVLKQLDVIDDIVEERKKRVREMAEYCEKNGIKTSNPKAIEQFVDCPFFFILHTNKNLNKIEPRSECPMRKSTLVKTIIKRFYNDLYEEYKSVNQLEATDTIAEHVVLENDFINIHQQNGKEPAEIFKEYL